MYEATQDLFSHGSHTELSKTIEDAFTAYVESDDFIKQHTTPRDQAAMLEKVFQIGQFLRQMYAVDNRVFKKAKKRFSKEVEKPVWATN